MDIRISVRNLVEFILRAGDIDNRRKASSDNAMAEGSRIHRMIQKRMGSEYSAEVPLSYRYDTECYTIVVDGRADGIIEGDIFTIDEIKGTYRHLDKMKEPVEVHRAQAKCYACIYAIQHELSRIRVRMTYCNMDTEDIRYFQEEYSTEELQNWFFSVLKKYQKWTDFEYEWKQKRQDSIVSLNFPFPYREGQKELATNVYKTIVHQKKLYLEAPTGVGKTISTVFPAVKSIAQGKADKIFYLTAKTITGSVADDTFSLLREQGLDFKTVMLTAKDKICFMEEAECNPDYCPYAKGHYDRINDAMYDLLIHEEHYSRERLEEYGRKYQVCPFEMGLDMSLFSDGIICDYNYLFDPHVYLRRFFGEGNKGNYLFLIDEAHNLVERGREMYSAMLIKEDFLALKKSVKVYDHKMEKQLEKCNHAMLIMKRECEDVSVLDDISEFVRTLERLNATIQDYLENHDESPVRDEVLDFYFKLSQFLMIYEEVDDKYVTYTAMEDNGSFFIRLFCVDPSTNLKRCMERGKSTVLFSATFLPIQYYKKLLAGTEEDYEVYAQSTFDEQKRGLYIARDVTSKYTRRNELEYRKIAAYIHDIVMAKKGNYMAFFPSHAFLQKVYDTYLFLFGEEEMECIIQNDYMKEEEREAFLNHFTGNDSLNLSDAIQMDVEMEEEKGLLGFCVMGGIFGEGIDLKNDSLIGAIIVGTGIPQVCRERELIRQFFEEKEGKGYDYAYLFPGMNKVLQAGGRVIRTKEDVGIIALLDERFLYSSYQQLFPREWKQYHLIEQKTAGETIKSFWSELNA